MADAADMLAEGCNAWHAIHANKGYTEQAEATRPFIDFYVSSRLPKWLNRFNQVLEINNKDATDGQPLYFVGDSLSYVDLAIFQVWKELIMPEHEMFCWLCMHRYLMLCKLACLSLCRGSVVTFL